MKGATAELDVKTMRLPSRTRQIIIGNSQNFFRSFMKDQSSNKNSPMVSPLSVSCEQEDESHHKDAEFAEIEVFFNQKLFALRPQCLRGEIFRFFLTPRLLTDYR